MASNDNLALAVYRGRDEYTDISYVLFDRNLFIHFFIREVKKIVHDGEWSIQEMVHDGFDGVLADISGQMIEHAASFVLGTIDIEKAWEGPSNGASMVHAPAASKGYGPLMYDIAMADTGELMPDREPGVSKSAQQVWKYYKNNRSDVIATPLDNRRNPQTPQKTDDAVVHKPGKENFGNFLDSSYHLEGTGPNTEAMTASFKQLEVYVGKKLNITPYALQDILWASADAFYDIRHDTEN